MGDAVVVAGRARLGAVQKAVLVVLAAALGEALLSGCSPPASSVTGGSTSNTARTSGVSRDEFCSAGQPALERVAAASSGGVVVVTWRGLDAAFDETTFRVYRRDAESVEWVRVAEVVLAADEPRQYVDRPPTTGSSVRYAVTEVGTCGEGPLCSPANVGQRCATAAVDALSADRMPR